MVTRRLVLSREGGGPGSGRRERGLRSKEARGRG